MDSSGYSWRSGAKVEKKLLKQWFIRTTKFAKPLLEGLNDSCLQDWRDIINLQQHWIGECNGYIFHLKVNNKNHKTNDEVLDPIRIWTQYPEHFLDPNSFLILKTSHYLNKFKKLSSPKVFNPFNDQMMPLIFYDDDIPYYEHNDSYLAAPNFREIDKELSKKFNLKNNSENNTISTKILEEKDRNFVLKLAQKENIGGYEVSSKLQDWLISRQRYWGTPIPIVYCNNCGIIPLDENDLPVLLPQTKNEIIHRKCPKCGDENAKQETDTMDTFVDSSWYYLRYLDAENEGKIFNEDLIKKFMPVDLYVGGKEHAVLHLYYARFMNHFLHSLGLVPYSEPFKRLLVQGMVMGRSYRLKGTGKYLKESEVIYFR